MQLPEDITATATKAPIPIVSDGSRRHFLQTAFLAAVLGALGCQPKSAPTPTTNSGTPPAPTSEPSKDLGRKLGVEILVDQNIQIPDHEFIDQPINFPKPVGLEIDDATFKRITTEFGETVGQGMAQILKPQLARAQNSEQINAVVSQFVANTADIAERLHPAFEKDMRKFSEEWQKQGRTPEKLIRKLNEYLNPAGYYLYYNQNEAGTLGIDLHSITKTSQIAVKDNKGKENVRVIHLGKALLTPDANPQGVATCDALFENALVFEPKIHAAIQGILESYLGIANGGLFNNKMDPKTFEPLAYRDLLRHEATHVFLARRFRKAGTMQDVRFAYQTSLPVALGKGVHIDIGGVLPPIMFQELCGVGVQIAKTQTPIPCSNILYMTDLKGTYQLVRQLLSLATLQAAPTSPLKDKTLQKLLTEGSVNDGDSVSLTTTPPFTMVEAKQVGEILYRVGYKLLEDAENGRLPLMIKKE